MPQLTEGQIQKNVGSGKDAQRAKQLQEMYAAATQPPHEDDAEALRKLALASGVADPNQGYATMDAKNFGRMLLSRIPGAGQQYDLSYGTPNDGGGFFGSVGDVLKKLAPAAGLFPGIGLPLGALVGAGGSALGGALSGDKFNLGKTLGAGAASGLAGLANPFGSREIPRGDFDIGAMGDQGHTPTGIPYKPGGGAAFNAANKAALPNQASFLEQVGNQFKNPAGQLDFSKLGQVAGPGLEFLGKRSERQANERNANAMMDLKRQQLEMGEQAYDEKAPFRQQALQKLAGAGAPGARTSIFRGGR